MRIDLSEVRISRTVHGGDGSESFTLEMAASLPIGFPDDEVGEVVRELNEAVWTELEKLKSPRRDGVKELREAIQQRDA